MLAHDGDDFGGDLVEDVQGFICAREIGEVDVRRYQGVWGLFAGRWRGRLLGVGEAHPREGDAEGSGAREDVAL